MRVFALLLTLMLPLSLGAQEKLLPECDGPYKGKTVTEAAVKQLLEEHGQWSLEVENGQRGEDDPDDRRANLCGAILSSANLSRAKLGWAYLSGAELWNVDLSGAQLWNVDLSGAKLRDVDLSGANLRHANLSGGTLRGINLSDAILEAANFSKANLTLADLSKANLAEADLSKASLASAKLASADMSDVDMSGADLANANLSEAFLLNADLSRTFMGEANLSQAWLTSANLSGANLQGANLSGATLDSANLSGANLWSANLSDASLLGTNLSGASVRAANLSNAYLVEANLSSVYYQPAAAQQPIVDTIATAEGLSTLIYDQPRALVNLRKLFKDAGYREQERQITYALRHGQTVKQLDSKDWLAKLEGIFSYVLFELTTKWGMAPGRALIVLAMLIPLFTLPYLIALWTPGKDGIWRHWSESRFRKDLGASEPERITVRNCR